MTRSTILYALLCVFLSVPLYGATEMVIGLDRSVLYEGETLFYQIVLQSDKPIDDAVVPDVSAFTDFHVEPRPKQAQSSSQFSSTVKIGDRIVQNRSTTQYTVAFTYLLTPRRTGSLTVPAPRVVVNGVALRPQTVRVDRQPRPVGDGSIPITVQPPDQQDAVRLEITADKERIYPFQPITVTLTVHIKELPGRFGNINPLTLIRETPLLTIPWVVDGALPKGLQPTQREEAWLAALNVRGRQRGFAINKEQNDDFGFSLFGGFNREFSPTPTQVKRPDADGREQIYWEYKFSRTFLPQELGTLTFGPAGVKGFFVVADSMSSEPQPQRIYALAPPIEVQVADVPQDDRPPDYIGAFGSFQWDVELQPRSANVGDPLTLTLSLTGRGSTANVTPPDLAQNQEITRNFRVNPPREDVRGEVCAFTYTIRPTTAGSIVFPPISVAFFDTEKEEFVFLESEPIAIEVSASEAVPIALPSVPLFGGALERSPDGLYANMTHGVVDQSVDIVLWAWTMASLVIGYSILAGSVFAWRRWHADPVRRRRRGALGRARRRLAEVRSGDTNSLQGVLTGYVADLSDGVEHGMTPKDVCVRLMDLGVFEQKVAEVRGILETLDGARFGGLDLRSYDDLANRIRRLLDEISVT